MKQIALTTLLVALGFTPAIAQETALPGNSPSDNGNLAAFGPLQGVLLLANGQTLSGKITRAGDHYFVVLKHGEIRVRAADVELHCRSLDEGYQRKNAVLQPIDLVGHLELADWCIRQNLFGYAAEQLAIARRIDPSHLRIGLVERRLELARQRPAEESSAGETHPSGPTNDELDRLTQSLPGHVIDQFANTVQPMLLNHCANSGCHGPSSATKYSLLRIPLGRTPSRRLTQRNLFATIQMVDIKQPLESPLLHVAVQPHGGMKTPAFNGRDLVKYQNLVAWVQRLAAGHLSTAGVTLPAAVADAPYKNVLMQPSTPSAVEQGNALQPSAGGTPAGNNPPVPAVPVTAPSQDPFDPEVFNRRTAQSAPN